MSKKIIVLLLVASAILFAAEAQVVSTTSGGDWNNASTWVGNQVPNLSSQNVVIDGPVTFNGQLTIPSGRTLTINAGKSLSITGNAELVNNGTFTMQSGGGNQLIITRNAWATVLSGSGTWNINTGKFVFNSNNSGLTLGNATIQFHDVTINNAQQFNFGGNKTINGLLKLENGSFLSNNNRPNYGANGVLEIASNLTASNLDNCIPNGSGADVPNHIVFSNSGTNNFNNGKELYLKGTLTVQSGATVMTNNNTCTYLTSTFQGITNNGTLRLGRVFVQNGATWNINADYIMSILHIQTGGTVNANSFTLSIQMNTNTGCGGGDIISLQTGGTFNAGTGTVILNPANWNNASATATGGWQLNNLVVEGTNTLNIPNNTSVTVNGNLTQSPNSTVNFPQNINFGPNATLQNNGNTSNGSYNIPPAQVIPSAVTSLTGTGSGNYAGAAQVPLGGSFALNGNAVLNTGNKVLTIAPNATLTTNGHTFTTDKVYIYGTVVVSNPGGLAAAFPKAPSGTADIIIGNGATIHFNSNSTQTIDVRNDYSNITISGNGTKEFGNGTHVITGNLTKLNGVTANFASGNTVTFSSNNPQNIAGLPFNNLNLEGNSTKTLTGEVALKGIVTFDNQAVLNTNNQLRLTSNATQTAAIGPLNNVNQVVGQILYERFVPQSRAWRFIGWPLLNRSIAQTWQNRIFITGPGTQGQLGGQTENGFDWSSNRNHTVFWYNEVLSGNNNQRWENPQNTSVQVEPGKGYRLFIRGDRSQGTIQLTNINHTPTTVTLSDQGDFHKGPLTVNLSCSNGCTGNDNGWHLIGNPYPSAIDWNNTDWVNNRSTNIEGTIHIINPAGSGQYSSWNSNGGGVNGGSNIIASGQSFFIKVNADGQQLVFQESYKSTDLTHRLLGKTDALQRILLTLHRSNGQSDQAVVFHKNGATAQYSSAQNDGLKLGPFVNGAISTIKSDQHLVFHAFDFNTMGNTDTIELHTMLPTNEEFFTLTLSELTSVAMPGMSLYLFDKTEKKLVKLLGDSVDYSFRNNHATNVFGNNRFALIASTNVQTTAVLDAHQSEAQIKLYPNMVGANEQITLYIPSTLKAGQLEVQLYDMQGRQQNTPLIEAISSNQYGLVVKDVKPGHYFVHIKTENTLPQVLRLVVIGSN